MNSGVSVSVLGGRYGVPYIKMEGCMKHKDRIETFSIE